MPVLKVLICGGGIAGPALAFWLARLGHNVTVLERSPDLRAQGQQIDIRGQAVEVCRRMGLLDTIRASVVNEEGLRFEDVHGRSKAVLLPNKSGKGAQTFTSEFEIMRGDLCRIFYTASCKAGASYKFGATVTSFDQDDKSITAYFSDGTSDRFDLLVGADGQNSKMRKMITPKAEDTFRSLGVFLAYFTVPRQPGDTNLCAVCHIPSAIMCLRPDNPKTAQAYLGIRPADELTATKLRQVTEHHSMAQEKQVWTELFQGAGWKAPRILKEMNENPLSDDFYFSEIGQVRIKNLFKGRVVLLGDAGYCPSPLGGMGTSSALVGAYVLAGEISRYCGTTMTEEDSDLQVALRSYDANLRPFVDEVQKLPPGAPGWGFPRTWWGIRILHFFVWLMSVLHVEKFAEYFSSDDVSGYTLPDYPDLRLK